MAATNRIDITVEQLLAYQGDRPPLFSGGGRYQRYYCPIHGSDRQRSLSLDTETGWYKCFACGARGRVLFGAGTSTRRPASARGGTTRQGRAAAGGQAAQATPAAAGQAQGPGGQRGGTAQQPAAAPWTPPPGYYDYLAWMCGVASEYLRSVHGGDAQRYLAARGIPVDVALAYGVGYAREGVWIALHMATRGVYCRDFQFPPVEITRAHHIAKQRAPHLLAPRIIVPHTDPAGRVINVYGRRCDGQEDHKHLQLRGPRGVFNAAALSLPEVYVCEGAFDALSLLAHGYPAVAIFGRDGLRWDWLPRGPQRLVFCLDADAAGQSGWRQLAREAELRGKEVYWLDPAAMQAVGAKDLNEYVVRVGRVCVTFQADAGTDGQADDGGAGIDQVESPGPSTTGQQERAAVLPAVGPAGPWVPRMGLPLVAGMWLQLRGPDGQVTADQVLDVWRAPSGDGLIPGVILLRVLGACEILADTLVSAAGEYDILAVAYR